MSLLDQPSLTFRPLTLASEGAAGRLAHLPFACDLIAALRPATLVSLGVGQGDSYFGLCQAENISARSGGVEVWRLWEELQSRFQTWSLGSGDGLGVILKTGGEQAAGSYLGELFSIPREERNGKQERLRRYYAVCGEHLELENKLKIAALTDAAADEQQRTHPQAAEKSLQQQLQIARGNVEELKEEIERLSLSQADLLDELREARRAHAQVARFARRSRAMKTWYYFERGSARSE
jgi:hypothetical protein